MLFYNDEQVQHSLQNTTAAEPEVIVHLIFFYKEVAVKHL